MPALTRSLPLVSPFQGSLKAGQPPPALSRPPVVPHQPLPSPRYDQYEICGLRKNYSASQGRFLIS
ncbi:MAG: hypothetical protein DVB29_00435 [Verrucomicrobia bacterium]|nr:MAG: hypothetical protein DVB29_00435 [Verrucomicrobiota bacterium]MDH4470407.1 hypothetical protein [Verrucomicrobiae bacterium]